MFFHALPYFAELSFQTVNKQTVFNEDKFFNCLFWVLIGIFATFLFDVVVDKILGGHDHDDHDHIEEGADDGELKITKEGKVMAIVNVMGDLTHNVIDGITIGATYMINPKIGLGTTFATLMHEIPHEISDFGVLVNSGFGLSRVILVELTTAMGAFVGTYIGLYLGEVYMAEAFAYSSGSFLFVAMGLFFHEIKRVKNSWAMTFCLLIGASMGLVMMYAVAKMEGH